MGDLEIFGGDLESGSTTADFPWHTYLESVNLRQGYAAGAADAVKNPRKRQKEGFFHKVNILISDEKSLGENPSEDENRG